MQPFRVRGEEKFLTVETIEAFGDKKEFMDIKDHICTDWEIYQCTLFHLMQNAIKFSKTGKKIKLEIVVRNI